MTGPVVVGLDFGTASARAVALDARTGREVAHAEHPYRHGTLTERLPGGGRLPRGFALQVAPDYEEAAEAVLGAVGGGREVAGIGVGFTASSPLPATADGTPLSTLRPDDPHAYVKLWRHAAQAEADRVTAAGGPHLVNFGGRVSGEWLIPKALEVARAAPATWDAAARFLEAGDWIVWRLTGVEARSAGLAAYKAQWTAAAGYPAHLVPGLGDRLGPPPRPVGSAVGALSPAWRARTGVRGAAAVAVPVIDSHAVLPAVGGHEAGTLVAAMGTSAAFLLGSDRLVPPPPGVEGVADGGAIPGLLTYETGTAAFGDTLAWLARTVEPAQPLGDALGRLEEGAAALAPGSTGLLALDWWGGSRAPVADARLSGLLLGLRVGTAAPAIFRALVEGLALGTRAVVEGFRAGGLPVARVVATSGLAERSPLLLQTLADALGTAVERPRLPHATAVGAAIHGAVAGGVVGGFAEGWARFGATGADRFEPDPGGAAAMEALFAHRQALAADPALLAAMRALSA